MDDAPSDRGPNGDETDEPGSGSGAGPVDRADVHGPGPRVEREVRTPADPERVWEAWADPDLIAGWFVERAVNRAEEGGRVTWAWDRFGVEVEQEVLVADSPRRLVLRTLGHRSASDEEDAAGTDDDATRGASDGGESVDETGAKAGDGAHILEVTIEADGGESVIRVVESGFGAGAADSSEIEGNDAGWALALAVLRHYVVNAYGRPRSELMTLRPVPGGCGPARSLFRTAEGLGRWLTDGVPDGVEPDAVDPRRLVLRDGRSVTGSVLADAHGEVVRVWEEVGGTVEFKAIPSPDGTCVVGLRGSSWELSRDELDAWQSTFDEAVARLVEAVG